MMTRSETFFCHRPTGLATGNLAHMVDFIETYGGVAPKWIGHNLERAFLIAWAEVDGQIVGTSCLKQPRPDYLKDLSERMELNLAGFLERGYTCVHPQHAGQGIASRLIALLTEKAGQRPYYALVQEQNPAIQAILGHNGEIKLKTFYSELAAKELGLWVSAAGAQQLEIAS